MVGQMGQLCDHSVCLCGRERFIALITDPTTQWASENPTSQPARAKTAKETLTMRERAPVVAQT